MKDKHHIIPNSALKKLCISVYACFLAFAFLCVCVCVCVWYVCNQDHTSETDLYTAKFDLL